MKKITPFQLFAIFGLLFTACNNDSVSFTSKNDSVNFIQEYYKKYPAESPEKTDGSFVVSQVFQHIDSAEAEKMITAYTNNPAFHILNPKKPGYATGFALDSMDFADIISEQTKYSTLGFYFAIKNYYEYAQGKAPEYTLVVIPKMISGLKAPIVAYDFVNPCPGSPGCPR